MALVILPAAVHEYLDQEQKMLVGGTWVGAVSGASFDVPDPASGKVTAGASAARPWWPPP